MTQLSRRQFTIGSAAMFASGGMARAADWPERPVTVVVPYGAGGSTDTQARIVGEWLSMRLGQRFIVENRPGAGGGTATAFVARAEPNGYTLLYGSAAQMAVTPLLQKVSYDPGRDFAPIATFGVGAHVLAIHPGVPAKTLAEFIDYAKSKPGKISFASGGAGTTGHLCAALFASRAGLEIVHVPYKGGAHSTTDLLSGQVEMYFGNTAELLPHAQKGTLRILATSTATRLAQLPDTPAIAERYPGFSIATWNGFLAPAGTPAAIVNRIAEETVAALKTPAMQTRLSDLGIMPGGTAGAAFAKMIAEERDLFREAVKAAGLSAV